MGDKVDIVKIIAIAADIVTITGVTVLAVISSIRRNKELLAFKVNLFLTYSLRAVLIIIFVGLTLVVIKEPYAMVLAIFKGSSNGELWENGKELQHILAYFAVGVIEIIVVWIFGTIVWTSSTVYATNFINILVPGRPFKGRKSIPSLEILSAIYGSDIHTVDLTDILRQMIVDSKLKVTANNLLGGDQHPGIGK